LPWPPPLPSPLRCSNGIDLLRSTHCGVYTGVE
jgi:hypothetical protein